VKCTVVWPLGLKYTWDFLQVPRKGDQLYFIDARRPETQGLSTVEVVTWVVGANGCHEVTLQVS